jgi:hypothetical protein
VKDASLYLFVEKEAVQLIEAVQLHHIGLRFNYSDSVNLLTQVDDVFNVKE